MAAGAAGWQGTHVSLGLLEGRRCSSLGRTQSLIYGRCGCWSLLLPPWLPRSSASAGPGVASILGPPKSQCCQALGRDPAKQGLGPRVTWLG